jgi:hypothetical protein
MVGMGYLRRNAKYLIPVALLAALVIGVAARRGSDKSDGYESAIAPERAGLITEVEVEVQSGGAATPLAECAGQRAVLAASSKQIARMSVDANYRTGLADKALHECLGSYHPSGSDADSATLFEPRGRREAALAFAASVDQICAVDFNEALRAEAAIEAVANRNHWRDARVEALLHYNWASSQAQTARLVGNLGRAPEMPDLVERWRANVAARGRLYRADGDAWKRGEAVRQDSIWRRIEGLKTKADGYGNRFGLQVCTSN